MPKYTDHLGRGYDTLKEMLEANGITASTYHSRRHAGVTGAALFAKPNGRCADGQGRTYGSQKEMLAANGLHPSTYHSRLRAGVPEEELFVPPNSAKCRDHTGRLFENRRAMAEAYGLTKEALTSRLRKGWPLKCALLVPMADQTICDHGGRPFGSMTAMAEAYGLPTNTVRNRLKAGWSLKNALTVPPGGKNPDRFIKDHEDNRFASIKDMCAHWSIDPQIYRKRLQSGMTMEQALTTPVEEFIPPKTCRDHKDVEYPSWKAMCQHYGLDPISVKERLERGWSLERALTEPARRPEEKTDWNGRPYATMTEMAKQLHVARGALKYRLQAGLSQREASAQACAQCWPGTQAGEYDILKCVSFPWFLCVARPDPNPDIHAGELLLHADTILALKQAG